MRETVTGFEARTGRSYQPPAWLRPRARPLRPEEACPTLFRYPGPCGLIDHLRGLLRHLGPVPGGDLWASEQPLHADVAGAALFGTLAVLQPLRHAPGLTERAGIYVGVNAPLHGDEVAWLPPSKLQAPLPWDTLATAEQVAAELGDVADERASVAEQLAAYVEEMDALAGAGVPPAGRPWCEVPADERRRLLADHGLSGRWTRA